MPIHIHLPKHSQPLASEVTPQAVWATRRAWLQRMALAASTAGTSSWAATAAVAASGPETKAAPWGTVSPSALPGAQTLEKPTAFKDVTGYNNFYEFGTDKADPARLGHTLKTDPWAVQISGLVKKPGAYALGDLMAMAAMEERIYRLRCVEGWSMVVPWVGYSLAQLIRRVEPLPGAKFVEFVTQADAAQMPGLRSRVLDWPYVEGLRMDEAMHPLSLLAFGVYGQVLPPQNGAPVRLVVPWKYGFKSAKSLVAIRFTDRQPVSSWVKSAPQEYGFYANVNPHVDHPRWSQATERRIGEDGLWAAKRKTQMFNGYEPQVGQLYAGMDLKRQF